MEWYYYPAIIIAGIAAGFINTLAGSGSLITLSLLLMMGVPANVANGSNRVGILMQNMVATYSFHSKQVLDWRGGVILSIPTIFGTILGAQIAVSMDEQMMRRTIGALMVFMLIIIIAKPKRWLEGTREKFDQNPTILQLVIFFFIGVYTGFIQAGVGIFLLAGLVLGAGYNLVRANAVKILINLISTVFALAVFIYNDQVWWSIGLMLAIGNSLGGWVAAHLAVEKGAEFVRYVLIAVVTGSALHLLGVTQWVIGLF